MLQLALVMSGVFAAPSLSIRACIKSRPVKEEHEQSLCRRAREYPAISRLSNLRSRLRAVTPDLPSLMTQFKVQSSPLATLGVTACGGGTALAALHVVFHNQNERAYLVFNFFVTDCIPPSPMFTRFAESIDRQRKSS